MGKSVVLPILFTLAYWFAATFILGLILAVDGDCAGPEDIVAACAAEKREILLIGMAVALIGYAAIGWWTWRRRRPCSPGLQKTSSPKRSSER